MLMNWHEFFQVTGKSYHSLILMSIISSMVIIAYLLKIRKQPFDNLYLFLHTTFSFIQIIVFSLAVLTLQRVDPRRKDAMEYSSFIFLVVELLLCSCFIRTHITNTTVKSVLALCTFVGAISLIVYGFTLFPTTRDFLFASIVSTIVITIASLYYFFQLFIDVSMKDLLSQNSFWAISGMLMFFSVVAPSCLLSNYLRTTLQYKTGYLVFINNISYSIMFTTYFIAIWKQKSPKY